MIVISRNFALNVLDDVEANDLDLNNPIIGYSNIITTDNFQSDEAEEFYPLANLLNPSTNIVWKAETTDEQYITITTNSADLQDYVGLANHNFAHGGIAVSVEGFDGSDWAELVAPVIPADNSPIIFRFTPQVLVGLRVRFQSGSEPPALAVMYAGKLLVLQRRIYVGHTPLPYGRQSEIITGRSHSGHFLGRLLTGEFLTSQISMENITPIWYRLKMDPFIKASREEPFFFAWRPSSYPDEVGFCWTTSNPRPVNQRNNGMMSINFSIEGISLSEPASLL